MEKPAAKALLKQIATSIHKESARIVVVGLTQMRKAAKLEQILEFMTDAQAVRCLDEMIRENIVEVVDGEARMVPEKDEQSEQVIFNSVGGKA